MKLNGWLPVALGGFIVLTCVIAVSILAGFKVVDTSSVTFVLGGAIGWAGGQRAPTPVHPIPIPISGGTP